MTTLLRDIESVTGQSATLGRLMTFSTNSIVFSGSAREKGDLFERLVKRILESDPLYSQQFETVWFWRDWPGNHGEGDTGIDLVAKFRGSDDLCAIQCKFYSPGDAGKLRGRVEIH